MAQPFHPIQYKRPWYKMEAVTLEAEFDEDAEPIEEVICHEIRNVLGYCCYYPGAIEPAWLS